MTPRQPRKGDRPGRASAFVAACNRMSQEKLIEQYMVAGEAMQEEETREGRVIYQRTLKAIEAIGTLRFGDSFDRALEAAHIGEEAQQ